MGNMYRTANITILLALSAMALAIGAWSVLCDDPCCSLRVLTGHACIVCGCTRDFGLIARLEPPVHNPYSLYIFVFLALEFAYRAIGALRSLPRKFAICDISVHVPVVAFILYWNFRVLWEALHLQTQ